MVTVDVAAEFRAREVHSVLGVHLLQHVDVDQRIAIVAALRVLGSRRDGLLLGC